VLGPQGPIQPGVEKEKYNLELKKKEKKAPSAKQQAASLNMNTIK
jgi:hypothetical protein